MKKYLCIDQGLRNAFIKDREVNEDNLGFVIENVVGFHLFLFAKNEDLKLFYFRRESEVDFILKNEHARFIEVKYGKRKEFRFPEFAETKIIVTRDVFEKRDRVLLIPSWLFLLIV